MNGYLSPRDRVCELLETPLEIIFVEVSFFFFFFFFFKQNLIGP